ncbi:MAG: aspartate--tRNA(Asn) ligase [Candidatus Marsarchaeota archaeon]|nr:aspartate--tRNA(Asn) ligase [Candidatus Marsarchaeota archaeon]
MAEVSIEGFVEEIRDLGGIRFIKVYTTNGYKQVTINKKKIDQLLLAEFDKLTRQSSIRVVGEEKFIPGKDNSGTEIHPSSIKIYSIASSPLPLEPSGKTPAEVDTRFEWRFLDLRSDKHRMIFKVQTAFERYAREYFIENGFIEIHSPKLIGAPSESGAEVFSLPYFGREAFLAQSPQFYKQMAICSGFNRVFEIGPVFRAEQSFTYRHSTEFTSLDVEIGYINSFEDIISFEQDWLVYIIKKIKSQYGKEIMENFGTEVVVPKIPFPQITMTEAYDIVEGASGAKLDRTSDLNSDGEKELGKYVKEKLKSEFVFLTEFPESVRPFYHMKPENNPNTTYSADLIYNGLEITTLAQREHRYDKLVEQAKAKGLHLHNIEFYLNFFKYGAPSHGGFGFGLSRMIMQLLDLKNVRESTFIPRDPKTLFP